MRLEDIVLGEFRRIASFMQYSELFDEVPQTTANGLAELQPENITFQKNLADFYYVESGRIEAN